MKRMKLSRYEKSIEAALERGEYVPVSKEKYEELARALESRRKNAVLNIRINQGDLDSLKVKAKKLGRSPTGNEVNKDKNMPDRSTYDVHFAPSVY